MRVDQLPLAALLAILAAACGPTPPITGSGASPTPSAPTSLAPLASRARPCVVTASSVPVSKATIELANGGTIVIALHPADAPNTVAAFANLARSGCYDGLSFHRVEPGLLIQGGDPSGDGTGGATQPAEYNDLAFVRGAVGIARGSDPRINNQYQFFICLQPLFALNGHYTNFGLVTAGIEVASTVQRGDRIKTIRVE